MQFAESSRPHLRTRTRAREDAFPLDQRSRSQRAPRVRPRLEFRQHKPASCPLSKAQTSNRCGAVASVAHSAARSVGATLRISPRTRESGFNPVVLRPALGARSGIPSAKADRERLRVARNALEVVESPGGHFRVGKSTLRTGRWLPVGGFPRFSFPCEAVNPQTRLSSLPASGECSIHGSDSRRIHVQFRIRFDLAFSLDPRCDGAISSSTASRTSRREPRDGLT
jgi:hypothetical protein